MRYSRYSLTSISSWSQVHPSSQLCGDAIVSARAVSVTALFGLLYSVSPQSSVALLQGVSKASSAKGLLHSTESLLLPASGPALIS